MPKYQFVSAPAAFSDALEQALVQRELQKRQALLDDLNRRRTEAAMTGADADRELARSQFDYRQQRDTTEDQFRNDQARQAAAERAAQAEAQRTFLAEQNDASRQSRAEQAQHDRELRELIARMGASSSAESRGLANELKRLQVQQLGDKIDVQRADRAKADQAVQSGRSEVYNLARELYGDPSLSQAVGPLDAVLPTIRPSTKDFENRAARLKNLLTFENRSKLKGQGAISDAETRMLEAAATSLDPRAGEEAFKRELQRIMDATGTGTSAASTSRVLRYNPVTGKVE